MTMTCQQNLIAFQKVLSELFLERYPNTPRKEFVKKDEKFYYECCEKSAEQTFRKPFNFGNYVKLLAKLLTENPELAPLPVFYAIDSEGNDYRPIFTHPLGGAYLNKRFGTMNLDGWCGGHPDMEDQAGLLPKDANAVIIN